VDTERVAALAEEIMRLQDKCALAEPISSCEPGFSLEDAYAIARELLARRERQGWHRLGRKIGFTNRTIYDEYGVYAPIFGYMYDRSVSFASSVEGGWSASLPLAGLAQPRLEPEIVFRLAAPPRTRDPEALLDAVEWLAHGFEIVQCHFPGWRFQAADSVADGGLHGRYVLGPPQPIDRAAARQLARQLATFGVTLCKNGVPVAEGGGELVLGSPLNALAHLVEVLASLPDHPPLQAGELVTTGTLTAALPVAPGETWSTRLKGLDVPPLTLRFE
jgi:2-oxo-3-hexenedioate decarboxylase